MDMPSHHFGSGIWVLDYIWQERLTPLTSVWTQATPTDMFICYAGFIIIILNLNHGPHQWSSGLGMMPQAWIYYPTVWWVLYESWTTSDSRGGSPHIPWHDHKLNTRHTQLLSWILEPRAWTMDLISGVVVQWWWGTYGYAIPLFYECYMRT